MSKTVVGLFGSVAKAQEVKTALVAEGFESSGITVVANEGGDYGHDTGEGVGFGQKVSNFFHSLAGGDDEAHGHYAAGVNAGGGLLAVKCEDEEAAEVAAMLKEHGARDIDGGYGGTAQAGVPVYGGASTNTGGQAIPVVEEELVVGKREVDRGGVRVYSHVVETPVATDVTLREERINVERRPVNREATAEDFQTGRGAVVELTATGEEAVVGKTSRVVEEVLVGKDSTSRTEAIRDSVRKTEVEVEEIPATTRTTTERY